MGDPPYHRAVRSFVRREGRLTRGQQRALDALWPRYGVDPGEDEVLDLAAVFGRSAPKVLEIGFGNGELLCELASGHPENDYLGLEVYRPGVGRLLGRAAEAGVANLRVMVRDAAQVVARNLPDACLDAVLIFFPDPWPKKRHHKRRLVQPGFVQLLRRRLRPGGRLHLATDWQDYARHMLAVMEAAEGMRNLAGTGRYVPRPESRPLTKFERRGRRLGHDVWDLLFERVP
jgi:tRNA (guanine-N7-)-methyltransferase